MNWDSLVPQEDIIPYGGASGPPPSCSCGSALYQLLPCYYFLWPWQDGFDAVLADHAGQNNHKNILGRK